ncbi:MAG: DUF3040 domain-containing protein [Actinomycetota bacterium]
MTLERALGSVGLRVARLAAGRDDRPMTAGARLNSLGAEETFEQDLITTARMRRALLGLSDRAASRLRARRISGQTLTVKVRFANFITVTRSRTLDHECASPHFWITSDLRRASPWINFQRDAYPAWFGLGNTIIPGRLGGRDMPLSDHEQRILQEIERQLYQEDPKFARGVASKALKTQAVRNLRRGLALFLLGLLVLLGFFIRPAVALGVLAFLLMLSGAILAYHNIRRNAEHVRVLGEGSPLARFVERAQHRLRELRRREDS